MNCKYSENDVALYVEGDLGEAKSREFEVHLPACGRCFELETELRESQLVFKTLRQDTVSASALAYMRTRVLAEVGGRDVKPGWGRWVFAMAGVAFAVVMIVGVAGYLRKPEAKQVVVVDPLPAAPQPAVPLTRGTLPLPLPVVSTPGKHVKASSVSVPLGEGDSRPRSGRQEVAQDEILTPPVASEPAPEPPKQIVVKLLTDNPNIVIYWLLDQKTGGTL